MTEYEYWTDFVRESTERITELNNALLSLERNPDDEAAMEDVFRVAHTLKGNCGAAGLESASELAHAIEDLLDAVRGGALEVSPELMDDIFDAVDELETIIETADGADDEFDADPSETIHALRDHLEGPAAIQPPSDDEIEDVLSRFEPPAEDRNVYLARLSVDESEADGDNAGILIVKALIDAFDLIGTDPKRDAIEAHAYNGRFDAVFASAVTESAIESGLEPVDEVADFELLEVTDRFAAVADAEATDDGATPAEADISADEAQDLEVDELLGEFDRYDDLDSMVEEVEDDDDLDAFDDMGKAGSFDDLLGDDDVDIEVDPALDEEAAELAAVDADESASESAPESDSSAESDGTQATDEKSEPASDSDSGSGSSSPVADPGSAEDPVEDADAVFQELKDEVEMVGFDELQDELAELEFDEFDTDDEVSMDELLGDDVADEDEDPFLESDAAADVTAETGVGDAETDTDELEATAGQPSDGDTVDTAETEPDLESPAGDLDATAESDETGDGDTADTAEAAETPDTAESSAAAEPADATDDEPIPLGSTTASAADDSSEAASTSDGASDAGSESDAEAESEPEPDAEPAPEPESDGEPSVGTETTAADERSAGDELEAVDTDGDEDDGSDDAPATEVADFDSDSGGFEPATDNLEPSADGESDDTADSDVDSAVGTAGGDEMVDFSDLGASLGSDDDEDATAESVTDDSAATAESDTDASFGGDDWTKAESASDSAESVGFESTSADDDEIEDDGEPDLESETETAFDTGGADFEAAFSGFDADDAADVTADADDSSGFDADEATSASADDGDAELESEPDSTGAFDDGADDTDEFDVSDAVTPDGDADEFGEDAFDEPDVSSLDTEPETDDFADETFDDVATADDLEAGSTLEETDDVETTDDLEADDAFAIADADIETSLEDDLEADLDDSLESLEFDSDSDASFEDTFGDDAFTDADSESTSFGESDAEDESGIGIGTETDDGATFEHESFGDDASSGATDSATETDETPDRIIDVPDVEIPDITVPEPETREDADADDDEIQSLRVDVEQVDELLTLVEGLVTSRVRLRHAVEADEDRQALETELDALEDLTTDLQETVMDVRLVPLETVTGRLPRVVRDIAREQEKEVAFEMDGGDVELDRTILDRISDPLIHLVRNAVDHGIESPDDREDAEKPREGTVEVTATRKRDRVTITVDDDGSGLDPDRIRSEAVEADVLTEAEAEAMADEAVYDLVFHPGLSTAEEVTDVSGRGVGMDVVDRTVTELDGTVSIDSAPGEGTTVTMTLPVSIAIDDILFIESNGEEFGLPTEVVYDVEPADSIELIDGEPVLPRDGGGDDDPIPVISLDETLETARTVDTEAETDVAVGDGGRSGDDDDVGLAGEGGDVLVRIRDDVRPVALRCDLVHGQQEVVVKPFEGFMRGIPGLSGATVRGRGKVVNILDVTTL